MGARPSGRFTVNVPTRLEFSGAFKGTTVKRRKRRAPMPRCVRSRSEQMRRGENHQPRRGSILRRQGSSMRRLTALRR